MSFQDHFSPLAQDYARFRPVYPAALFDWLAAVAPARDCAWDCGTGNGQAARALGQRFRRVLATDASEQQIAQATPADNIDYRVAPAEHSGLPAAQCDLVCVAQALHWFAHDAFFAEVARVGRPRSVLAAWTYTAADMPGKVGELVRNYCRVTLADCWAPQRALVESGYATIVAPFEPMPVPRLQLEFRLTQTALLGYLGTWSAGQTYRRRHGVDPLVALAPKLCAAWPPGVDTLTLDVPLRLRAWRLPGHG